MNGRAERLNGILIHTATALLEGAKLSRRFWEDATNTASYIYNRIPHKPINNKIPYELLFKEKVNYNNIRTFGCKVVFLTPKQQKHKLDNSASLGIFIGYCQNPNAYKIFDVTKNKIVFSRVVEFYEDEPGDFYFNKQIDDKEKDYTNNEIYKLHLYSNTDQFDSNNDIRKPTYLNDNNNRKYKQNIDIETTPSNTQTSPNNYNESTINFNITVPPRKRKRLIEPENYEDIFNLEDKEEWLEAVDEERNNFQRLNVYSETDEVPEGANIISGRWVLKHKKDAEGNVIKRKARLVAKGFTQQPGIDYNQTFSPTLKQDSLRIITAIASQRKFNIEQIDINSAYLNAKLDEDIYMKIPEGFPNTGNKFWKLNKAIYGLKQSGRAWNNKLNDILTKINFRRIESEPCIYKKEDTNKEVVCMLAIYVDDILIAGTDYEIYKTKKLIKNYFQIKDIGNADFIIGIKFQKINDGYFLHQKRYILDLINKYKNEDIYPSSNLKPIINKKLQKIKIDVTRYKSLIGNLLYIAISTRPDIIYPVSKAAQKSNNPTLEDWVNTIKILGYLKFTINYGLKFDSKNRITAYSDADYAGDLTTRRSTTGYVITIGKTPISWCSKLQPCVSTSTAEAEYYSLSECAKQCIWYMSFLNELNVNIKTITIMVDNKATIFISENRLTNQKSKHIDIRYHFVRELIRNEKIKLEYVKSQNNIADGFTKYLNSTLMKNFRNNILNELK